MRSIHTTKQENHHKNNTPYRVIHQHRTKLGNPIWGIILSSASIIALSSILLTNTNVTYAEGSGGSVSLSVDNSDTVLELTIPSSVSLNLTPTTGSAFGVANLDIGAGTNSSSGYRLFMVATSNALTRTSAISDGNNGTFTPTILPILTTGSSTGYDETQFKSASTDAYTLNRWGYKLSTTTNYIPMTTDSTELRATTGASNATENDVTLNFAVKIDGSKPAGTYTNAISFNMIVNGPSTIYVSNSDELLDALYVTARSGDTITLLDDIDLWDAIYFDKEITINGNGHRIGTYYSYDLSSYGQIDTVHNENICTLKASHAPINQNDFFYDAFNNTCKIYNIDGLIYALDNVMEGSTIKLDMDIDGQGMNLTMDKNITIVARKNWMANFNELIISAGTYMDLDINGVNYLKIIGGGFKNVGLNGNDRMEIWGGEFDDILTYVNCDIYGGNYGHANFRGYTTTIYGGTFGKGL